MTRSRDTVTRMPQGHQHPVNRKHRGDDRTIGERAADRMRNSMGSWPFVFAFMLGMVVYAAVNTLAHLGGPHGFDKYPYVLLNLLLSTLAGLQGAILLIAAKRSDKIGADLAEHDYKTNVEAKQTIDAVHALTREVHAHIVGEQKAAAEVAPARRARKTTKKAER